MQRWMATVAVVMAFLACCLLPVAVVHAAELEGGGTEEEVSVLNDLLSTLWGYLSGPAGKVICAGLMVSGFAKLGSETGERDGKPWKRVGGGAAVGFVPPLANSVFETAAGATGALAQAPSLLALAWQGFLANRLVQDPVFLVVLVSVLLAVALRYSPPRRVVGV